MKPTPRQIESRVSIALEEDLCLGDPTTDFSIPADLLGRASVLIKSDGVLAGMDVAREVFKQVDASLNFNTLISDGAQVRPGDVVGIVEGSVSGILKAERTMLNFLQHLCGIATATSIYVKAVSGTKAKIVDTRKTTPGLRPLEKYAVIIGGGNNHRQNLGDGILMKDNHLSALGAGGMSLKEVVGEMRSHVSHTLRIEVEVDTVEQAIEAIDAKADIILLDNMAVEDMRRVVELVQGQVLLEASGKVNMENVREIAETGVDLISVGALTHSVKSLDISLELTVNEVNR